ncbi:MAG: hypothetical protein ACQETI_05615 [Halobacteriota archaeon]
MGRRERVATIGRHVDGETLPELDPGVIRLHRPSRRSAALHRLVVSTLDRSEGNAYWVDARNDASTYALYDLTPTRRTLDGLRIARAFTAYQHHSLVRRLPKLASSRTALVVAPCVTSPYAADDVPERQATALLESTLALLTELASVLDVPVLVTAPEDGPGVDRVDAVASASIECTETDVGLSYSTDDFQTQVYHGRDYWQTTIPYWVDLLGALEEYEWRPAAEPTLATVVG